MSLLAHTRLRERFREGAGRALRNGWLGAASRARGPPARGYPMTLNLCVNPSYWKFEAMMRPGRSTFAYSSV